MPLVRIVETRDLSDANRDAIRRLLDQAFEGGFSDDDWLHALGGWHAVIEAPSLVIAHAAVVERELLVGGRRFHTGYVEAVAVAPARQRTGLGAAVRARPRISSASDSTSAPCPRGSGVSTRGSAGSAGVGRLTSASPTAGSGDRRTRTTA